MPQDQQFLDFVIKGLVDHPADVVVTRVVDQMGVLLTLTVHKEDMGKIIGRDGATAKAIRTLLRVAGMKSEARVNLKINEPDGSPYVPTPRTHDGEHSETRTHHTNHSAQVAPNGPAAPTAGGYNPAPHQMAAPVAASDKVDAKDIPQNYQSEPKEAPRMKSVDEILESL
jgi:uncharacterized protein